MLWEWICIVSSVGLRQMAQSVQNVKRVLSHLAFNLRFKKWISAYVKSARDYYDCLCQGDHLAIVLDKEQILQF